MRMPVDAPPAWHRRTRDALAGVLTLSALLWAADVPRHLGLLVYGEQFLGLILGQALGLVFLHVRVDGAKGGRVPWYDAAAATAGMASGFYVAWGFPTLSVELAYDPSEGAWLAGILLLLVVEGLRRVAGRALAVIVVGFFAYGLLGELVPGRLAGRDVAIERLVTQLMLDGNGLLGPPLMIAATIVVVFVLFGRLLNACGGARFFTELAMTLMGRYRGGPAKISIAASALFGSISGSAVSNVATTGIVTIPLMRRAGFPAAAAGGIEAVASTGGQLMPPIMGASAFLMAEFLQVAYADVVLAALIPALLYFAALFIQADLRAARDGIAAVEESEIPRAAAVLRRGWIFPLPFAVLIYALFGLNYGAAEAGLVTAGVTVLLGAAFVSGHERLRLLDLLRTARDVGTSALDIILITAAAGIIIGVLNVSGLGFGLTLVLTDLAGHHLALLLVVAALISIVLGMGMPTIGVYVLLAALVAPALVKLGIPDMAAHMFVLYFGMMSMITPPVAIAAFAAASLGGSGAMKTALESMRFGWPAYVVPFLFVLSPALLMDAAPWRVAFAAATAAIGVWLVSVALVGYLRAPLGALARGGLSVAGLAVMTLGAAPAYLLSG